MIKFSKQETNKTGIYFRKELDLKEEFFRAGSHLGWGRGGAHALGGKF